MIDECDVCGAKKARDEVGEPFSTVRYSSVKIGEGMATTTKRVACPACAARFLAAAHIWDGTTSKHAERDE